MLSPEERALMADLKDRLIELYVERDETAKTGDRDRVRDLQSEIEDVAAPLSGYLPLGDPRIGLKTIVQLHKNYFRKKGEKLVNVQPVVLSAARSLTTDRTFVVITCSRTHVRAGGSGDAGDYLIYDGGRMFARAAGMDYSPRSDSASSQTRISSPAGTSKAARIRGRIRDWVQHGRQPNGSHALHRRVRCIYLRPSRCHCVSSPAKAGHRRRDQGKEIRLRRPHCTQARRTFRY
jgi:hypothetical protein